jgi:chromate transporter
MAIVAAAVIRIGRKALRNGMMWALAALAFVAIFFFDVAFPLIIGAAAACGLVGARLAPRLFTVAAPHAVAAAEGVIGDAPGARAHLRPSLGRAFRVTAICLALWWLPVLCVALLLGRDHAALHEGLFFSKAAMVTFGGAYAVLPYVAQQAVEQYGWLTPGQMLDGLGLAETTPGPLIMVVQFVGFLGGWHAPGPLAPLAAATLGAAIATWVTFLPSFLWILVGAPWIEALRANTSLSGALSCITAAVVGVVLNLAVWFAMHVVLPAGGPVNWFAVIVAAVAFVGLVWRRWGVVPVIAGAAVVGLVLR